MKPLRPPQSQLQNNFRPSEKCQPQFKSFCEIFKIKNWIKMNHLKVNDITITSYFRLENYVSKDFLRSLFSFFLIFEPAFVNLASLFRLQKNAKIFINSSCRRRGKSWEKPKTERAHGTLDEGSEASNSTKRLMFPSERKHCKKFYVYSRSRI